MTVAIERYDPPEPTPLVPERSAPLPYPVDALGPTLAGFTRATVEATRCAEATAAQSGLAVASLAAQAHADVITPAGLRRPLSLFLLTVALTGERKTAADTYALAPVRQVEDEDREAHREQHRAWRNRHDAWEAQRSQIKRAPKTDEQAKRQALDALGPEPVGPLRPERTASDVTIEGLIKCWTDCHASRGLFTAEGALLIAGHAMTEEARLRTAGTLSTLWDEGRAERIRAIDGQLSLRGRRLAMHLMAQPGVAARFTGAADLADQGLVGRFLVCAAPEQAGTRFFRDPPPIEDPRFQAYDQAIKLLLRRKVETLDDRNELNPRTLAFTPEAREVWRELHDHIEARLSSAGELGEVKSFGNKLAEHCARITGVLALLDDPDAVAIETELMERAVKLADFYAFEAVRLSDEGKVARPIAEAETLRTWLMDGWREPLISVSDAMQFGPSALRPKATMSRCFDILIEHGWLVAHGPDEVRGERRRETFIIIRRGGRP